MGDGSAPVNDNATMPDVNDLFTGALDEIISGLTGSDLPDHAREVLENLDTEKIIEDLLIADENGEHAIEVIVAKQTTEVSTSVVDDELVDHTQETKTEADEAMEQRIQDIVGNLADQARAEAATTEADE